MYDGDTVELLLLALDEGTGVTRAARGGESESPSFPLTLVLPFRHDVPNGERRERWDTRHPSTPPSSSLCLIAS